MPWAHPAGPERGSEPGPAAMDAAARATLTDADLLLGKLDPDNFAGGAIRFDEARRGRPRCAMWRPFVSRPVSTAFGIARSSTEYAMQPVHAVESGQTFRACHDRFRRRSAAMPRRLCEARIVMPRSRAPASDRRSAFLQSAFRLRGVLAPGRIRGPSGWPTLVTERRFGADRRPTPAAAPERGIIYAELFAAAA